MRTLKYLKLGGKDDVLFVDFSEVQIGSNEKPQAYQSKICDGVTVTWTRLPKNAKQQFPKYNSWLGLEGWRETIMKKLGWTIEQANACLIQPDRSVDLILNASQEDLEEIYRCNPFTIYTDTEVNLVERWLTVWKKRRFTFYTYAVNSGNIEKWNPQCYRDYKRMCLTNNHPLTFYVGKRTDDEYRCLGKFGFISPFFTKYQDIIEIFKTTVSEEIFDKIRFLCVQKDLDFNNLSLQETVKNGLTHKDLFPSLTKSERAFMWENYSHLSIITLYNQFIDLVLGKYIWDTNIRDYIRDNKSFGNMSEKIMLSKWCKRNIEKLNSSREVHGPAGQTAMLHYNQLIRHMTPEMFTNGEKTAWRRVTESLQEVVKKQLEAQLGNEVSFDIPEKFKKAVKGLKAKIISHSSSLKLEGEIMEHCVAGYINTCIASSSVIVHIGDAAPNGSTAEFGRKNSEWVCFQNRAIRNTTPTYYCENTKDIILKNLNKKEGGD